MTNIASFLSGNGSDSCGRSLEEIMQFDDEEKEFTHDYIQWIFPLNEPSGSNFASPVLSEKDIAEIRNSNSAQENLRKLSEWMLKFLARSDGILMYTNHNHLRVTRIIKSLRILHSDELANKFRGDVLDIIEKSHARINPITIDYWLSA